MMQFSRLQAASYSVFSVLGFIALTFASIPVHAQAASAQPAKNDHPLIARFPDSEIVEYEVSDELNHLLVLGTLQRTRGEVVPEASERLKGRVTRIVYAIPSDYQVSDVREFFARQLRERGDEVLYSCEGRSCGSSNYWANDIFKRRILYGPERNQYYLAARSNTALAEDPFLALYLITRANRRLYAYMEIIERETAIVPQVLVNEGVLASSLIESGSVILPSVEFDSGEGDNERLVDPEALDYLVRLLQRETDMRVYIVSHLSQPERALEAMLEQSENRAQLIRELLIEKGIDSARVKAAGVGPLAPSCALSDCRDRIELVVMQTDRL
jgi:outer membrane protein OmpA-like peptidoglycan-associated protein